MRSYEAAEDNELSFREGDRIVEIEAASDEWWQGKDAHGNVGLFPGAYLTIGLCVIFADGWVFDSELC
jgi:drebrin-like protein